MFGNSRAQLQRMKLAGAATRGSSASQRALLQLTCEQPLEQDTLVQQAPIAMADPSGPGRRIGNYEILEQIGAGGMGAVFRVRSILLDRVLALKVILAGQLAIPSRGNRLRGEPTFEEDPGCGLRGIRKNATTGIRIRTAASACF